MIEYVKCVVVDGIGGAFKNSVPIFGDAVPKGVLLGYIENGTIVLVANQKVMSDDEKRKYVDNGYTQVLAEDGSKIFQDDLENWIEVSHLIAYVKPIPVPEPEPVKKQVSYRIAGLFWNSGVCVKLEEI